MITPKEIEQKTMSPEKRKSAKNDYFAFYVGRPLSYILTIPFLYTNITPNTVSLISIIPLIVGFEDCETFIEKSIGDSKNLNLAIASDDEYMGTVSLKHIDKKIFLRF